MLGHAVIHESLNISSFKLSLTENDIRIEVSKSALPNTCVFPKSSMSFLIISFDEGKPEDKTVSRLENCIKSFIETHERPYILVITENLNGSLISLIGEVQQRLLSFTVNVLFPRNYNEATQTMIKLQQLTNEKNQELMQQHCKALLASYETEDVVLNILQSMGLSHHDSSVALDGAGSIAGLAAATNEQLLDCGLSKSAVKKLQKVLGKSEEDKC